MPPYVQVEGSVREQLGVLALTMLEEFKSDSLWRNELIRNKLSEFLIYFDRLRRQNPAEWKPAHGGRSKSIWPIVHYVHTHHEDSITLNGLAEMFDINRSHLSAEFKRQLGLNFVRFLHEIRIRHACSLLACTDISIFDIAIEAGFGSFKSFSRIFSELKRMTPGEYRKRYAADAT
ncbi:MAG: AraC family transcriptional regulator, partial [Paenibacillus sp.]|nr:AraC family transcriptional regulator [Paenibacillus sp.]